MVELTVQDSPNCAQVGPKMVEVGAKTVQSRTEMAPGKLKLVTSWHQDCMKADISQACMKPTKTKGKTMISRIPQTQFASKMAQVRAKIRSQSELGRLIGSVWRLVGPSWRQYSSMRNQRRAKIARFVPKSRQYGRIWGSRRRNLCPRWRQDGRSWTQDGPK